MDLLMSLGITVGWGIVIAICCRSIEVLHDQFRRY